MFSGHKGDCTYLDAVRGRCNGLIYRNTQFFLVKFFPRKFAPFLASVYGVGEIACRNEWAIMRSMTSIRAHTPDTWGASNSSEWGWSWSGLSESWIWLHPSIADTINSLCTGKLLMFDNYIDILFVFRLGHILIRTPISNSDKMKS